MDQFPTTERNLVDSRPGFSLDKSIRIALGLELRCALTIASELKQSAPIKQKSIARALMLFLLLFNDETPTKIRPPKVAMLSKKELVRAPAGRLTDTPESQIAVSLAR